MLAPASAPPRQNGGELYSEAFLRGIRPDPRLSVSEWADAHRVLSEVSSNEHGPYRVARTPYWREVMDALSSHSPVQRVTVQKGAQLGATELGNNWIGYVIDVAPGPMMCVAPNLDLARKISRQRLDPMFDDTPRLRGRIHSSRAREAQSSVLTKGFPGGMLALVGANAPAGFRSMPARYLMRDEVDAYPEDVGDEGDPLLLSERATRTYESSKKILDISTPTIEGRSRIEAEFRRGDRRYYFVPCPGCGEMQRLEWANVVFDSNLEPEEAAAASHMVCTANGCVIEEHDKPAMLADGEWRPEVPTRSDSHRSYHLSALYAPFGWRSWAAIVETFLKAKGKPTELRTFVNHDLGETWKEKGERPEWEVLYRRRAKYRIGTVPAGVLVLTAGVDVQGDRVELEVVGHGAPPKGETLGQTWSVDYVVLNGSPKDAAVWRDLADYLSRDFEREGGGSPLRITRAAVDSGAYTQDVYRWVRRQSPRRVIAIKGSDRASVVLGQPRAVDVEVRGRRLKRGIKLWMVGVSILKEDIYGRLAIAEPLDPDESGYPGGYCHFPEYPEEFFRQLTAEQLVTRVVRGYRVYQWELAHGERNEVLDCRVYALAAAESIGLGRWTPERWLALATELGETIAESGRETAETGKPIAKPARPRRRRGGMKGTRRWRSK